MSEPRKTSMRMIGRANKDTEKTGAGGALHRRPFEGPSQLREALWQSVAARLAGLNVRVYQIGIHALSGATAGLAGMLLAARTGSGSPMVAARARDAASSADVRKPAARPPRAKAGRPALAADSARQQLRPPADDADHSKEVDVDLARRRGPNMKPR
jgi:hypothetical protein